ncbi:MAG TPA: serine/threonine-protein kinase, partial [Kofleriaceae bacterium]
MLGHLGSGGMGVVLSAYDPVLDRRVALKLVRPSARSATTSARALLRREAQAMARLSHPNVVAVHDVGEVGGQQFIAMEFVDGQTLRDWLRERHDWREVVRMFRAVGAGLAAAHAAGLVHRDFKPENVLIGRDGRPRVVDFGLVVETGEPGGAGAGTPGYMSPEQLVGDPNDARGDQFSFCVALYEALDGEPPFAKRRYYEDVLGGRVPALPRRAPRWIGEIVLRGLGVRLSDRWPDMPSLLAALDRDRARSRRSIVIAASVAGLVAGAVALTHTTHESRAACGTDPLRDVWDGGRRAAVERSFSTTALPYVGTTFTRVAATLDQYASAWTAMHDEVCRAPTGDGAQAASLRELRMACLDARRSTLAALTDEWAHGIDAGGLENAVATAASLPSLDLCGDTRALVGHLPLPLDPAARARIDATRAALDRVRALRAAGRMQAARTAAEAAYQRALADHYPPASAEAALLLGSVLHAFGEPSAIEPLQQATTLAERAGDDGLAASAAIELLGAMVDVGQTRSAIAAVPLTEALVVRAGDRHVQRGMLRMWQGDALIKSQRTHEGVEMLVEARALLTEALGPHDPLVLEAAVRLYKAVAEAGELHRRDKLGEEVLATALDVLGPDHPQTAALMGRIGEAAADRGDFVTAHQMIDRALAITERTYGPDSLPAAVMVNYQGVVAETENHLDVAAKAYERVLAIRRHLLAPEHPLVAHALANLALAHHWQHRGDQALAEINTARAIMLQNYGEDHNDVAYETAVRGSLLLAAGRAREAREDLEQAVAIWKRIDSPDQINVAFTTLGLVQADIALGRYAEARTLLTPASETIARTYGRGYRTFAAATALRARCDLDEHGSADRPALEAALHDVDKPDVPPSIRGAVRFELARAEWAAGDRPAARAQTAMTERDLVQAGAFG